MKFFKTSLVIFSFLVSHSSAFAVAAIGETPDGEYVKAAQLYPAVGMVQSKGSKKSRRAH